MLAHRMADEAGAAEDGDLTGHGVPLGAAF
jgi:hypothetical protein